MLPRVALRATNQVIVRYAFVFFLPAHYWGSLSAMAGFCFFKDPAFAGANVPASYRGELLPKAFIFSRTVLRRRRPATTPSSWPARCSSRYRPGAAASRNTPRTTGTNTFAHSRRRPVLKTPGVTGFSFTQPATHSRVPTSVLT